MNFPYLYREKKSPQTLSKLEVTEVTIASATRRLQRGIKRLQEVTLKLV